ncbi:BTAD domain-containing putative transcriptional regulator [Streptomyces sp. T-3]|nr:BTAD domain-containing putative transcriptional regulator [Streptomyces sp. T-3]
MPLAFRTLGPLELLHHDRPVVIGADKQRTLLATLLAHHGRSVPVPLLVREIWGEEPPRSAHVNLRSYVMQLRRLLPAGTDGARIVSAGSSYELHADGAEFDVPRFHAHVTRARQEATRGHVAQASAGFARALRLWRGLPLENVVQGAALREFTQYLTEEYLTAVEEQATLDLDLGRHRAVVERLRRCTHLHPLRERLYCLLMLSLYRCGDAVGALGVFAEARRTLRDELGMDPGAELLELHRAVLNRAPELLDSAANTTWRIGVAGRAPRHLPRESAVFVGRKAELAQVTEVLCSSPAGTASAPVVLFHGPAGHGKSALALRSAHSLTARYPDGQLYADLAGSAADGGPQHTGAGDILARFLRALGSARRDVPAGVAEAGLHYQSLLAGRRVLVVLDNAPAVSLVLPLIPADPNCAVLVTSRGPLPTLDADRICVRPLDEPCSVGLLGLLIGAERVAREPVAAARLARLCGHHPLALRIVGARLVERPEWSLTHFGDRLRSRSRRLDELQAEGLSVRGGIADSHRGLLAAGRPAALLAARAFRLLGERGLREFSTPLLAGLLGSDERGAACALDELVGTQLVEPVTESTFRIHELTLLYAAELAATDRGTVALPAQRTGAADAFRVLSGHYSAR